MLRDFLMFIQPLAGRIGLYLSGAGVPQLSQV